MVRDSDSICPSDDLDARIHWTVDSGSTVGEHFSLPAKKIDLTSYADFLLLRIIENFTCLGIQQVARHANILSKIQLI